MSSEDTGEEVNSRYRVDKMSENREIIDERIFTIPLDKAWISPSKKRTPRQLRILRNFIKKNMRSEEVLISKDVNEKLWSRGIEGRFRKIRVKALKDKEDVVTVHLSEG